MQSSHLFPGIHFETVAPAPANVLPRMDIAAFVGFASSGPLHVPVVIEDITQFRDFFGPDVPLAWDYAKNGTQASCLGAAVEAFFRNGGRRCWVVRVADETQARTLRFRLPGLIRTDGARTEAAYAQARCAGSWAANLRVGAQLQVTQLYLKNSLLHTGERPVLAIDGAGWSATLSSIPDTLSKGDLLQLNIDGRPATLFLFVDRSMPTEDGVRLSGTQGFWYFDSAPASPPAHGSIEEAVSEFDLFPLADSDRLGLSGIWPGGSPLDMRPRIRLLRYELLIWNDGRLQHRLGNLGFHHSHPRFGGHLPTDSELFRLQEGRAAALNADATDAFFEEVKSPRFPLAGPQDNALDWFYLPVGMPFTAAFEFAQEPVNAAGNREPVDKSRWNGLARFDSALFIDQALNWADTGSLLAQAEQRAYLGNAPRALRGIHSLFAIDEITLIAVPDAIHRRWTRMPPPVKPPLAAPFLETIETKRASGKIELRWDAIGDATGYIVEQDSSAAFDRPVSYLVRDRSVPRVGEPLELMPAADNFLTIPWPSGCPASYYFRVRAERHGEVSAWSNTRARLLPPTEFLECELSQPDSLELKLALDTTDASRGLVRLSWTGADAANGEPMSVDRFQVEQAKDIEFHSADRIFSSPEQSLDVQQPTDANFYFRVRGQRGKTIGPWSNSVRLTADALSQSTLEPAEEFVDSALLDVHRALMRFCAARGDVMAILSMPYHYRHQSVLDHVAALAPAGGEGRQQATVTTGAAVKVPPLTMGEKRALSYAALYYPWLSIRSETVPTETATVRFVSPDGVVAGAIARRTLEQAAWFAPANDPLVDVIALQPPLDREQWAPLMRAAVNTVHQDPRGFLLLSEDTLSAGTELRSIHVRRLLILLRRLALREGNTYVFEPNDEGFRDAVHHYFERLLSDLYTRGAFAGVTAEQAYRVLTDSSVNTPQSIDRGRFIVELRVAPSEPLKFLNIRLTQSGPNQFQLQEA